MVNKNTIIAIILIMVAITLIGLGVVIALKDMTPKDTSEDSIERLYVIEANNSIIYVDKETKLVKKYIQGDTTVTLSVEEGTVTADDIAKDRVYE